MKKKVMSVILATVLILSVLLTGCSNKPAGGAAAPSGTKPAKKQDVVIGTGGTAGTYYVIAAAMASAINNNSQTINVIAQPSKGSVENLNLANSGDIQMGMSNSDGVYFAANGTNMYEKTGKLNISGVMSLYMSAGQMATLKSSGIETYGDLKGKKVVLGPPSTTIVEMSKAILIAYGIDPEKDITPYYLSFDEGLQKLTDGEVDASFFVAGIPTSAMINATSTGNVKLVDVDRQIIDKIAAERPYFIPYKIPAGTYKGTDKDINTFKIMTEIFVNNDVPEDVVYEFVKQAFENYDEYKDSHVVAKEITPETAVKTSAPLHPGAAKYFKEIGVLK
ncbi:MAG: TAXI family TRAP transporter solute-binding subunit [Caulobacteraceae bacterium]